MHHLCIHGKRDVDVADEWHAQKHVEPCLNGHETGIQLIYSAIFYDQRSFIIDRQFVDRELGIADKP